MGILLNKKTFFLFVLCYGLFLFTYDVSAATLVRPPNNLGLVGYWSFNEGTSTVATDFSGTGNTGTLTGGPTWSPGKLGNALNFDGSDDRVQFGTTPTLDITGNITIAAWIYPRSFGGGSKGRIFDKNAASASNGYDLQLENASISGGFSYLVNNGGVSCLSNASVITLNRWQHIVVSYNGSSCSFYVDGTNAGSPAFSTNAASAAGITANVGGRSSGNDRQFDGYLDEVRVYNRALTVAQVSSLYNSGISKFAGSNSLTQGTSLNQGLRGHWTFDGKDMVPNVRDLSGNGNHGILYSGTGSFWPNGTTSVAGKLGQALSWTVIDLGINILSASTLDDIEDQGGGGVTASAWIYRNNGGSIMTTDNDCHLDSGTGRWRFFANTSGGLDFCKQFATTNLRVLSGNSFIPAQTWTHVAYTWDGSNSASNVHFYVNGTEVTSYTTQTNGSGAKESDAANNKFIGNGVFSGQEDYIGYMDDVRIYNRVLTISEIKQLYNLGEGKTNASSTALTQGSSLRDGLVGLWTFDGQDTVSSIADKSGQGNNGSFIGSATSSAKTIGKFGQALNFNGTSNYVDLPDTFLSSTAGAISIWFKTPATFSGDPAQRFAFGDDGVPCNCRLYIGTDASGGALYARLGNAANFGTFTFLPLTWYHVTLVWRPDATGEVYVNGVSVGTTSGLAWGGNPTVINIGSYSNGTNSRWLGLIDEVRAYNRALTTSEVKQLYLMGN